MHSFATAAAISPVHPRPARAICSSEVSSSSSHSRNSPTVWFAISPIRVAVERVVDHARHFVALVRDNRILAQVAQRQIGEHDLRRDAFLLGSRRDAREFVARARLVGACEHSP